MHGHVLPPRSEYTKDHEWVRVDGDTGAVGITDFAQQQLGDVVYVDLPEVGTTLTAGQTFGTIESVKAVSELYAPVSGEVTEVNTALKDKPEQVNTDAARGVDDQVAAELAERRPTCRRSSDRTPDSRIRPSIRRASRHESAPDRSLCPAPHRAVAGRNQAAMLAAVGAASLDALIDEAIPSSIRLKQPLDLPDARKRVGISRRGSRPSRARTRSSAASSASATTTRSRPASSAAACSRTRAGTRRTRRIRPRSRRAGSNRSSISRRGHRPDGDGSRQRVAARRGHGGRRGDDAAAPRAGARSWADDAGVFLVSDRCFPQTIDVLRSRAEPLGIELRIGPATRWRSTRACSARCVQYPDEAGRLDDLRPFIARAHAAGALVAVATDLLALALVTPPGEMGADVVFGNSQRLRRAARVRRAARGVLRGEERLRAAHARPHHRRVGRRAGQVGVPHGAADARAAHPPREGDLEHLHRAGAAGQHGGDVRRVSRARRACSAIATRVHDLTRTLDVALRSARLPAAQRRVLRHAARVGQPRRDRPTCARRRPRPGFNFRYVGRRRRRDRARRNGDARGSCSASSRCSPRPPARRRRSSWSRSTDGARDVDSRRRCAARRAYPDASGLQHASLRDRDDALHEEPRAQGHRPRHVDDSARLVHDEAERGERDVSGLRGKSSRACTRSRRPTRPRATSRSAASSRRRCARSPGFAAVSLQPNSGAQGEFAGLLVIRAYHQRPRARRTATSCSFPPPRTAPIPPAPSWPATASSSSATDAHGNVDVADLRAKAEQHRDKLAALMITYPSTHGVFEDAIRDICAHRPRARRAGVHGRREHERAGRA